MTLESGSRLGPYEVTAMLGAGGMGQVYRARDTRLDRAVAIKILPEELARDPDRRSRFEREARAIAALNHPHICTVYDVGREHDVDYLVMELIEGQTLADRLQRGALELVEALACATQIADALATAHRHGIVHRDLKPGNVMLARTGSGSENPLHAKLLDFGLARLRADNAVTEVVTATGNLTRPGQIMGTLNYMAPEQLEGRPHDARVDVFALGAILFEMITGRRAFDGPNPASVAGAVLHVAPPPLTTVVSVTPPALERLVAVCLSKSPDDRWSSAHDVLLQLRALSPGEVHLPASPGRSASRERVAWGLAAALGAVAAAVLLVPRPGVPGMAPGGLDVVSILPPEGAVPSYAWEAPQVSPDGRQIAVAATDPSGTNWLYVRGRDSLESRRLPGTEDATLPFWSPDSTQLGFFAAGQLKTVALAGGAPSVLAAAPVPRGGTWNADNVILFSAVPNSPPGLVAATGGEVRLAPAPAEAGFRSFPQWLPDGRHYIYQALDAASRRPDVLRAASIDTTDVNDIVTARGHGVLRSGFLLYRRDSALVAQPFDVATRQLTGTPSIVADQVGLNAITYQSLFSASTDAIAFLPSPHASQLFWLDRQGRVLDTLTPPGDYNTVCLTADGRRAVFDRADASTGAVDLWQLDIDTHQSSRLTFDAAVDFHPVCSPSGPSSQDVIFASLRAGPPSLFRLPIGAPGSEKAVLTTPPAAKIPSEWTRDGRWIVFSVLNAKTSWDIAMWPVEGGEPTPVVATQADEHTGRVSPDGRWIAYAAKEPGGQFEIYAQPFPGGGAKWQVSRGGGKQPYWRADGAELYYLTPDRKLMAVPVGLRQGVLAFGEGRALMETRVAGWETINSVGRQYAVSADGQRFLVSATSGAATPITLMLNWAAKTAR